MGSSGVRQWGDFASVYGEFLLSVDRSRLSGPVSVVSGTWETRWQELAEEVERWRKKAQNRWGFRKPSGYRRPTPGGRVWLWARSAAGPAWLWRLASGSTMTGRSQRRMGLRPEATTSQTTLASTPW